MTALTSRSDTGLDVGRQLHEFLRTVRRGLPSQRGIIFGVIILVGMVAFEVFNFSTTEFALADLLGDLSFAGLSWATILALAFCSIDFAGIARLMTPHDTDDQPIEIWYLLAAWFLGATMNAMLTWWSVSLALINHQGLGNEVLGREALLSAVPIFIAGLVWLIRVLLIGTLTLAGQRLFSDGTASSTSSGSRPAPRRSGTPEPAPAAAAFDGRTHGSPATAATGSHPVHARGRR
ncbi:MAG: hypothetical protein R3191_07800 [Anaerolineales bacterium]|nr:hypothetical protein [Anaerolineales bacterium]